MHTEHHIQAAAGVDPAALDDQVAETYGGTDGEEPRLAPSQGRSRGKAVGFPPLCVHGTNSFADAGYDLALARLRRG